MPRYRIVFPPEPGLPAEESKRAHVEVDEVYKVGDIIEYHGHRWEVTQLPLDTPLGDSDEADILVWPAD